MLTFVTWTYLVDPFDGTDHAIPLLLVEYRRALEVALGTVHGCASCFEVRNQ